MQYLTNWHSRCVYKGQGDNGVNPVIFRASYPEKDSPNIKGAGCGLDFPKEVIMRSDKFINKFVVGVAGLLIVLGSVNFVLAQRGEYNEYQEAVRNEQRQRANYQRNPSRSNYNEWMDAQRDVQVQYAKYQRALQTEGNGRYTDPYGRVIVNTNNYQYRNGTYRIYTNGQYSNVDSRGYNVLREAVNRGYQQGYRAGLRDRRSGRYNYYNNSIYQSGSFGYNSYVARNQYQYYFQQGFQRGYEDGFNAQTQYGYRNGSTYNILGSVLNTIFNIADAVDNRDPYDR